MFLNYIFIIISKDVFPEDDIQRQKWNYMYLWCPNLLHSSDVFSTKSSRELQAWGQCFLETIGRRFALHETHKKSFFRLVIQEKRSCLKFVFFSYINTEFLTTWSLVYTYMYIVNKVDLISFSTMDTFLKSFLIPGVF